MGYIVFNGGVKMRYNFIKVAQFDILTMYVTFLNERSLCLNIRL